jgi:hypothetical protein
MQNVQQFGANTNKAKLYERINKEQIIFGAFLLPFGPKTFYLPPFQNLKTWSWKYDSVILYGCKTWSLITQKEKRLKVFDKAVLRKIKKVTGENYT